MAAQGMSDADFGMSDDDFNSGGGVQQGMSDADFGMSDSDFDKPQGEGALGDTARAAAHGVIPTVGGLIGMGAGAAVAGPVGAIAGMAAGSYAGDKLQEGIQKVFPSTDDSEQMQADIAEHPRLTQVGGFLPAAATLGVGSAGPAVRAASAGIMGAFQAVQDKYNTGSFDPAAEATAMAVGAAFPGTNKLGSKIAGVGERLVPGRPGKVTGPETSIAHDAVDDSSAAPVSVEGTALAEEPPNRAAAQNVAIGNPESRPTNSQGDEATGKGDSTYAKGGTPSDTSQVTTGDMDPATSAALEAAKPAAPPPVTAAVTAPPKPPITSSDHPVQKAVEPVKDPINNAQSLPAPAPDQQRPLSDEEFHGPVHTGFPKPGDPVAVGANEATALPKNPDRVSVPDEGIKQPINNPVAPDASNPFAAFAKKPVQEFEGNTAAPTPDQARAGNYLKANARDFGKYMKLETPEGEVRKSHPEDPVQWENVSPADYGYFTRTKGADWTPAKPDGVDFYRPAEGSPLRGDKHFVIDQKDPVTGAFDEHKVMANFKDQPAAVDTYYKAFSDGSGPSRLHDVTEASHEDLTKWLARTAARPVRTPYGEPMDSLAKPLAERAVVQDAVAKLRAKGETAKADALLNAPDEKLSALAGMRTRKYGVNTGLSAGYPIKGLLGEDGRPVTANSKKSAAVKASQHEAVQDWFDKSSRPSQLKPEDESNGELLDRIKGVPAKGWSPGHKPAEWLLAREARRTLAKPTPANVAKFRDTEGSLRGSKEDVDNWRSANRTEADIALSRRGGDDAVSNAEGKIAAANPHSAEDEMIEKLDAKRGFEIPHEESEEMVEPRPVKTAADLKELPHRTVDVHKSPLADINTNKIMADVKDRLAARKAEQEKLAAEAPAPGTGKKPTIDINDPAVRARLIKDLETAKGKGKGMEPGARESLAPRSRVRDLLGDIVHDESGKVDVDKFMKDFKAGLKYMTTNFGRDYSKKPTNWNSQAHWKTSEYDEYLRSVSDDFHQLKTSEDAQTTANKQWVAKVAKETTPELREKLAFARDENDFKGLTNSELQTYRDLFARRLDDNDAIYQGARVMDPDLPPEVESHLYHIMKGGEKDILTPGASRDPLESINNVSVKGHGTADERKYFALERNSDGQRMIIEKTDNGFKWWNGKKAITIQDPDFKFEAGEPYKAGKVDYTMRDAHMREIERNVKDVQYHHDIALSVAAANEQVTQLARNQQYIHGLTATKQWDAHATTSFNEKQAKGYHETLMPVFNRPGHTWFVDDGLKSVIDQFAQPGLAENGNAFHNWRTLSQMVTKSIFWNPTIHAMNAGVHYVTSRGWDNLDLAKTVQLFTKDLGSVIKQDALQKEILDNGGSLMFPGVMNRSAMQQFGKLLGHAIEEQPAAWDPLAKHFGFGPSTLTKMLYDGAQKSLWAANDVFYTNLYRAAREKGMSIRDAINHVEQDYPNYRLPPTIFNKRGVSMVLEDPLISSFGRYHGGMVNGLANIAAGLVDKNSSMTERVDAVGKIASLLALGLIVKPLGDKFAQYVTGNPDASIMPRGALTLPFLLAGKSDATSTLRGAETISPFLSAGLQIFHNRDFADKPIMEPGDWTAAKSGDPKAAGAVGVQSLEFLARLFSPVNTMESARAKGQGAGETLLDQLVGIHDPSFKGAKFERKQDVKERKAAQYRINHGGRGLGEDLYNRATGR